MDRKIKIYITIFILCIGYLVYADYTKQKPISWFPSFVSKHKIPYGTYVLRNELPHLFPNTPIKEVYKPPYLFLKDSTQKGTYFFVDVAINFGKEEFEKLLKFVEKGNDVFISTSGAKIDTLHTKTTPFFSIQFNEKISVSLVNPIFKEKNYTLNKTLGNYYFKKFDTIKSTVLGTVSLKNKKTLKKEVNFIKYKHGKGTVFLHTYPIVFTNYAMLKEKKHEYVAGVLSYLDDTKPIFWDAYYKTGKSRITSKMHYILNSKNLKWSYYIALIGVLFFIIFKGKREQRYIPVITPLKNQTLAFTRTIANMYYEKSSHKNIATKTINYFLEFIRNTYRISTDNINKNFMIDLAHKSNNQIDKVTKLFAIITQIKAKEKITKEELIILNILIEQFKKS